MLCSLVVEFVEATASLLSQALVVIEEGDDASWVDTVTKGLNEVLAHMKADVCSHQVTQPASVTDLAIRTRSKALKEAYHSWRH